MPLLNYVANSTAELLEKINICTLNNDTCLAILDIISLYPSLGMQEIVQNIVSIISNQKQFSMNIKASLIAGLNITIQSNVFFFNKEY